MPKIGLALSGGGAKGLAHVGVLRVLEEAGIRPDFITGTSMGSIVGGLYAIGYSVDQLEVLCRELPWDDYFDDQLRRDYIPIEEREAWDRYQIQFPLKDGKIQLPKGIIGGQQISMLLSRLTFPAQQYENFDDFPIPFRCVATDFETGGAVVLRRGSLADALRASMSIPSVFEPIVIEDQLLIDGMSIRNLPVEDVIKMGAEVIIAVDVGGPLYTKDNVTSIFQVLEQTSSYRIVELNDEQLKLADVIIRPQVVDFSGLDFNPADTLMALGTKAAQDALPAIQSLLPQRKGVLASRPEVGIPRKLRIDSLSIQGLDQKKKQIVINLLRLQKGKSYTLGELEKKIERLPGSQFIKSANYYLRPLGDGYMLKVVAIGQTGDFLKVSANYDSNLRAGLLLNATLRNWLLNGSRLSIDFKLSENPMLQVDYLVYTGSRPGLGVNALGRIHFYPGFFYEDDEALDGFEIHHYEARAELLGTLNSRFLAAVGVGWERFSQTETFLDSESQNLRLHQANIYLRLLRDTYDRFHFPREGSHSRLVSKLTFDGSLKTFGDGGQTLPLENLNYFVRAQMNKLFPLGRRFALHWYNDAGAVSLSEDNLLSLFYLGRNIPNQWSQVNFVGLDYMQQPASSYVITGLKFRMEPARDYFASLMVNYGYFDVAPFEFTQPGSETFVQADSGHLFGAGIELGVMTRIGPAWFRSEMNLLDPSVNFVLHLGYLF
ncbi:MAG: patatin-like phospholipase family protein [Bacteroidota bacterium]